MTMDLQNMPEPRKRRRKGVVSSEAAGKAVVYLRVSTDEQAADGNSLASQEARCRALCTARGLTIAAVYVDAGKSGGTLERDGLSELRATIRAGQAGVVVVYAVDRLSRSQRDTLNLL